MLGRATLGNPWLITQIRDLMEGRIARPLPEPADRLRFALVHYRTMVDELGEARAVPQMRKHVALYLKGIPGAAVLRERIMRIDGAAEAIERYRRDDRAPRIDAGGRMNKPQPHDRGAAELYGAATPRSAGGGGLRELQRVRQSAAGARDEALRIAGRGARARMHDLGPHGKAYLDFAGGYGVFTLGYSHPRVARSRALQLERIALSGKTMFNVLLGRAARRLAELAPGDLQISFWCNSGTEAIEGAIKLARAATGRAKIVGTIDAFHGKTFGALSVSGRETFQTPFRPLLADSIGSRSARPSSLEEALRDAAAFVVEPVQGEGGVHVPPAGYLRAVREVCDETGALFIADEIQTGHGPLRLSLCVRSRRRRSRRDDAWQRVSPAA